jgi:hypothetical protein
MRRLLALASAALVVSWCGSSRAQLHDAVYFGGTCLPDGVAHDELVKILAAELSPSAVSSLDSVGSAHADVVVLAVDHCAESPPSARISVWHGADRRERTVVLADVPQEDRTRTLALALAETRLDPAVSRPAAPEPVPWVTRAPEPAQSPLPAVDSPPAARRPTHDERDELRLRFRASVAFRHATETSTPAGGVFLGAGWSRIGVGASVFGARKSVDIGQVTLWVTSATAYYDVVRFSERLRARGTLDIGFALASGAPRAPARGDTQASFNAALHAGVVGTLWRGTSNDVEAALAVGYASSLRAQANGADAASLDGLLLTASLGLGFR